MLNHIKFINTTAEEFLNDVTTGKWTILHMGSTTGIGNFTFCLDLNRAAYTYPTNDQPNELRFYFGQVFPRPAKANRLQNNRSSFNLRLTDVLEISTTSGGYTGYVVRYRDGDSVLLAHSPIYEN